MQQQIYFSLPNLPLIKLETDVFYGSAWAALSILIAAARHYNFRFFFLPCNQFSTNGCHLPSRMNTIRIGAGVSWIWASRNLVLVTRQHMFPVFLINIVVS